MDIGLSPASILAGWLSSYLVEWAKNHPKIPLSADNTKLIKLILRGIGSLLVLLVAYLDGRLSDGTATTQEALTIGWELVQFLVSSKLAYKNGIQGGETPADPAEAIPVTPEPVVEAG